MLIEIIIGYGFVDEVSALYGLIWNKPKYMYTYAFLGQEAFGCWGKDHKKIMKDFLNSIYKSM